MVVNLAELTVHKRPRSSYHVEVNGRVKEEISVVTTLSNPTTMTYIVTGIDGLSEFFHRHFHVFQIG